MLSAERILRVTSRAGFSTLDILVTLAITAAFAIAAIPQYQALSASFARDSAVKQVEYDIRRAKAEAVSRSVRGVLEVDAGGETYTVGVDLVPFSDPPSIDQVLIEGSLPHTTSISTDNDRLVFDSRGFLIDTFGDPVTGIVNFSQNDELYAIGTIYATGVFLLAVDP